MRPVTGGTQKLTMDSAERDYQQKLRVAQAQGDGNPFVAGIQGVFDMGAGQAAKQTRTKYGNVNIMPQEILEGETTLHRKMHLVMHLWQMLSTKLAYLTSVLQALVMPIHDQVSNRKARRRLRMYAKAISNADLV